MEKNNQKLNKIAKLAQFGDKLYHTDDLANFWGITNKNTLYTTIKRYVRQKVLFRVHKGFYSVVPPHEIDPFFLGIKALHRYAYISTESVLVHEGIIQQLTHSITLVSDIKKRFQILSYDYLSRRLPDNFLHQSVGIEIKPDGICRASIARAVADLLYFNKNTYFDAHNMIDWKKVKKIQQAIGYPLTLNQYD